VTRARSGGGPSFIEARVYRFRAHGGSGDDTRTGYRDQSEPAAWLPFDPIAMFEEYLRSRNALDAAAIAAMDEEIGAEIARAFEFALASPNPAEADLHKHVYAE
jgi:2-oxoisovalerate dehydrogenase E1 component alpha subunit